MRCNSASRAGLKDEMAQRWLPANSGAERWKPQRWVHIRQGRLLPRQAVSERYAHGRAKWWRCVVRSKLTRGRAELAEGLVAEGLTLDAIADRLGVHRRTILRWVARDAGFRERYARARRYAHEMLHDELQD